MLSRALSSEVASEPFVQIITDVEFEKSGTLNFDEWL